MQQVPHLPLTRIPYKIGNPKVASPKTKRVDEQRFVSERQIEKGTV